MPSIRSLLATRFATRLLAPLAVLSAGCTGTVAASQEGATGADASSVAAVVSVERTSGLGAAPQANALGSPSNLATADGARGEAVARVLRVRSGTVDDDALRMVGATVDFPAMGSCARVAVPAASNARAVELLDVGAITLEADGARTNLVARRLPDVTDLVSGVVYTTRSAAAEGFPAHGRYGIRVAGTTERPDIAPFAIEANVPGEPADLRIAGQDGAAGAVVALGGAGPIELGWASGAALAFDVIYVDVTAPGAQTTRCLFADSGHASIPSIAFADDGTLSVHRVHREAFRAPGVDTGELRFDFARVVTYRKR